MIDCKINIDLDDKIEEFCKKELDDNVNVEEYINKIVKNVAIEENIDVEELSVSISCATKDEIKEINNKYRNIDKVTDVLSFPIFSREELIEIKNEKDVNKKLKSLELGDIILCLDVIKSQSIEYKTGVLRETLYMITHAMCHLVGYDHLTDEEKKEMRLLEEKILDKIGVGKTDEK